MTTKYCDPLMYVSNGTFSAGTSGSSATLTLTTPDGFTGNLNPGMYVSGTGLTAVDYIAAVNYNSSRQVVSVTLSAARTVSAGTTITTTGQGGPAPVPKTWGVCEEGDGEAKTAATSASVSIDMSTWVFTSGSSTFSVMGATAMAVGAGANSATVCQYSATLTTMIDNIVICINTYGTNAVVNVPAGWPTPLLRNSIFARRNGNSLELMTRAGSAAWNTLVAMTFTNVTNSSAQSWASGVSGCWGWLLNMGPAFGSGLAPFSYGCATAGLLVGGVLNNGDTIKVRTKNPSGNITLFGIQILANQTWIMPAKGTAASPYTLAFDSGTEWAETDGQLVLRMYNGIGMNSTVSGLGTVGGSYFIRMLASIRLDGTCGFVLENYPSTWGGGANQNKNVNAFACNFYARNCCFSTGLYNSDDSATTGLAISTLMSCYTGNTGVPVVGVLEGCQLVAKGNTSRALSAGYDYSLNQRFVLKNSTITYIGTTIPQNVITYLAGNFSRTVTELYGCSVLGLVAGSRLVYDLKQAYLSVGLIAQRCYLPNCELTVGSITYGESGRNSTSYLGQGSNILVQGVTPSDMFVSENTMGGTFWIPGGGQPTLSATTATGMAMSIGAVVAVAGVVSAANPLQLQPISNLFTGTAAALTITLNWLADKAKTLTKDQVWIEVSYIRNDTGAMATESSHIVDSATVFSAVSAATADWIPKKDDGTGAILPFATLGGADRFYLRYQHTLTTSYAVKQNTYIHVQMVIAVANTAQNERYFYDPEVLIT